MGDLLKNFKTISRDRSEFIFPHPDKSRHVSTTVGQLPHPRGRVGRKIRIIHQRSKQEKAYLTSLESRCRLPTVGEREKRAAHWSDVLNSYEDRTEIRLYCCWLSFCQMSLCWVAGCCFWNDVILSAILSNVILLNAVIINNFLAECYNAQLHFSKCHYVECPFAECHCANMTPLRNRFKNSCKSNHAVPNS